MGRGLTGRRIALLGVATVLFAGFTVYAVALAGWGDCTTERAACEADRLRDQALMLALCVAIYGVVTLRTIWRWRRG